MTVKLIAFEEAALNFAKRIISTLPTTGHKLAAGAMLAGSTLKLEAALSSLADKDGNVDTDVVRKLLDHGFAAAGEKATFTVGLPSLSWLLEPISVTITREDVDGVLIAAEKHVGG